MIYSIIGRVAKGTIGFGSLQVSGRSLVPDPPAMITAFKGIPPVPGPVLEERPAVLFSVGGNPSDHFIQNLLTFYLEITVEGRFARTLPVTGRRRESPTVVQIIFIHGLPG